MLPRETIYQMDADDAVELLLLMEESGDALTGEAPKSVHQDIYTG